MHIPRGKSVDEILGGDYLAIELLKCLLIYVSLIQSHVQVGLDFCCRAKSVPEELSERSVCLAIETPAPWNSNLGLIPRGPLDLVSLALWNRIPTGESEVTAELFLGRRPIDPVSQITSHFPCFDVFKPLDRRCPLLSCAVELGT